MPVERSAVWDNTHGDALVGDWSKLLVGVREDIRFEMSTEGILQDDTGAIVVNAFQDDVTLLRAFMRVGIAIGKPIQPDGSGATVPFEFTDWTSGAAARTARAAKK
jgi:hypothetical protein